MDSYGSVLLRLVLGVTFLVNGIVKFQTMEGTVAWFESIGLPPFLAYAVAALETAGGLALLAGAWTRTFAALFAVLMIGAIVKVKLSVGFLGNGQVAGWELDLALLAIALYLALNGSRTLSVDRMLQAQAQRYS